MDDFKILVVDDEQLVRYSIKEALEQEGFVVSAASQARDGLTLMEQKEFDVVISDLRMPGLSGLELLQKIKEMQLTPEVILITAYGTIESAVEAMKMGAYDYVTKPFEIDELIVILKRIQDYRQLQKENKILQEELKKAKMGPEMIGKSRAMKEVLDLIKTVAGTDSTVLIQGESGVGKELVAANIHASSKRNGKPFIKVSCPALSESLLESELFGHEKGAFTGAYKQRKGRFEIANNGTIFLDEIGELTFPLQAKLLRVLQEKQFERVGGNRTISVNARVVCATKKDLLKEVEEGHYREDLYYRLNVFPIYIQPLRERREDIPLLLVHFMETFSAQMGKKVHSISSEAASALFNYSFPGNVRELQNIMERAVILSNGEEITPEHLPSEVLNTGKKSATHAQPLQFNKTLSEMIDEHEKKCIKTTLQIMEGNKGNAAKVLGISRKNLWEKIKKHQL
jgi:two-component system response regulator AtoC